MALQNQNMMGNEEREAPNHIYIKTETFSDFAGAKQDTEARPGQLQQV